MSYLQDKKIKRNRYLKIAIFVIAFFVLVFFKSNILGGLSGGSQKIFYPVLMIGNNIGEKVKNLGAYFLSKKSLYADNQSLQAKLNIDEARMLNYDSILAENENLKNTLGRKNTKENMVLGAILTRPNQSPYDTLIIDAGISQGVKEGNTVFALGDVPIGRVASAYQNSSKIILFSNAGEKTQAIISGKSATPSGGNIFMELVGRGGGNFEMILPKDLTLQKGDQAVMPGINPYILAVAEKIISDPRDPSNKVLLVSPVNIQELKFVEIAI